MNKKTCIAGIFILAFFVVSTLALGVGNVNTTNPQILQLPQNNLSLAPAKIRVTQPIMEVTIDRRLTHEYPIKWEYSGFKNGKPLDGTTVRIKLYHYANFYKDIAGDVLIGSDGVGSYTWNVEETDPPFNVPNDWYVIRIECKTYNDVKAWSGKIIFKYSVP